MSIAIAAAGNAAPQRQHDERAVAMDSDEEYEMIERAMEMSMSGKLIYLF